MRSLAPSPWFCSALAALATPRRCSGNGLRRPRSWIVSSRRQNTTLPLRNLRERSGQCSPVGARCPSPPNLSAPHCDGWGSRCPFRKSLASSLDLALIRPGRVDVAFKLLRPWTKPRAPLSLLTACLTEWGITHQGCPGIGPTIGMGMTTVIVINKCNQPRLEVCH